MTVPLGFPEMTPAAKAAMDKFHLELEKKRLERFRARLRVEAESVFDAIYDYLDTDYHNPSLREEIVVVISEAIKRAIRSEWRKPEEKK